MTATAEDGEPNAKGIAALDLLETALDNACREMGPELVELIAMERIQAHVTPRPVLTVVSSRTVN